jgi:hypothetical protein
MNLAPTISEYVGRCFRARSAEGWHFEIEDRPDSQQLLCRAYKGSGRAIKYASTFIDVPTFPSHKEFNQFYKHINNTIEYLLWYAQLENKLVVGQAGKWRKYGH